MEILNHIICDQLKDGSMNVNLAEITDQAIMGHGI